MASIPKHGAGPSGRESSTGTDPSAPHRPTEALLNTQSTTDVLAAAHGDLNTTGKRRNHRGGKKKKKNRRQSFLPAAEEEEEEVNPARSSQNLHEPASSTNPRPPFYRLGQSGGRNLSETSLDSNVLLDHRYLNPSLSSSLVRGLIDALLQRSPTTAPAQRKPSQSERFWNRRVNAIQAWSSASTFFIRSPKWPAETGPRT